jgi:uncharacterized protein
MEYTVGTAGRIIVARLETGEPIYSSIEKIAEREKIDSAAVWIIGGIKNGGIVVGPGEDGNVMVERFEDPREIIGVGMLFKNKCGAVKLHLHAGIGKGTKPLVGCPREGADCWLVNEIVIQEITGIDAKRLKDEKTGFDLLTIFSKQQ